MKHELRILDRGRLLMPPIVGAQPMPAFSQGAEITWPGLRVPFVIERVAFGVGGLGEATIFTTALHVSAVGRRTEDEDHPVPWPWEDEDYHGRDIQERTHFQVIVAMMDGSEVVHHFEPDDTQRAMTKFQECVGLPGVRTVRWYQYARGLLGSWHRSD